MSKRLSALLLLILGGCASGPEDRYDIDQDHAPESAPTLSHLEQPQPRYEPKSRGGNKSSYVVRGIEYQVLPSAAGFDKTGTASWYGQKFHGHLTSNGESYDMYGFSAAHKSLPLPTYVKVTNQANQRSIVVRVNDRGPFHGDREIDLSYAAAAALDMLKTGTAIVRVQAYHFADQHSQGVLAGEPLVNASGTELEIGALTPPVEQLQPQQALVTIPASAAENHFIQVVASGNQVTIGELKQRLSAEYSVPSRVTQDNSLYKLQLGPFATMARTEDLLKQLRAAGYNGAFKLIEPAITN
ncbi:septal ring lytic transglycosylase RlpA family protein [Ferrimonas senticii]|uniref:septal ring lytic transglycosylase RlpA family protein n=1 Tax=Ferrimonas senticii TaxID=394566 RepID=UPI00042724CB|nr:septal ring lytic transglycosylase RlpA family protein [Ferrimonas senticii]